MRVKGLDLCIDFYVQPREGDTALIPHIISGTHFCAAVKETCRNLFYISPQGLNTSDNGYHHDDTLQ